MTNNQLKDYLPGVHMEKEKFCTRYVDYVRECVFHLNSITKEIDTTLRFCISGDYKDCPFFRFIKNPAAVCENFKDCSLCQHYKNKPIDQFVDLSNTWCLSDFTACARYKIKQSGCTPESTLHPEGHLLDF